MDQQKPRNIVIRVEKRKGEAQIQEQRELTIFEQEQKYTIGSSERMGNSNHVGFRFADSLNDKHFELDYSLLQIPKNMPEFLTLYNDALSSNNIDQNIIEKIGQFTINERQKLQIKDISGRQGYLSLINITNQCENQVLIKGNKYIIGQKSQLKVEQNNQLFGDFLQSSELLKLFNITNKTKVIGLGLHLDQLFKQSFDKKILEQQFFETLKSEELKQEFQESQSKGCMYINITYGDQKQSYLLVENTRNQFTFGRDDSSDIIFKSFDVSSYHGIIQYISSQQIWIIMDGQQSNSTYGTWLQMKPNQIYYLDQFQRIKVQKVEINFNWK